MRRVIPCVYTQSNTNYLQRQVPIESLYASPCTVFPPHGLRQRRRPPLDRRTRQGSKRLGENRGRQLPHWAWSRPNAGSVDLPVPHPRLTVHWRHNRAFNSGGAAPSWYPGWGRVGVCRGQGRLFAPKVLVAEEGADEGRLGGFEPCSSGAGAYIGERVNTHKKLLDT